MSYLTFKLVAIQCWAVHNKKSGDLLGTIWLYPRWRKKRFVLGSYTDIIWTWDCLQEVSEFMKKQEAEKYGS